MCMFFLSFSLISVPLSLSVFLFLSLQAPILPPPRSSSSLNALVEHKPEAALICQHAL